VGRFLSRREEGSRIDHEEAARKAIERAELMSTTELLTWMEGISSTIAIGIGSYASHRSDDIQLHEARRQTEVLHGLLTVLISRT
jgi:flavin-binding protein dodecin